MFRLLHPGAHLIGTAVETSAVGVNRLDMEILHWDALNEMSLFQLVDNCRDRVPGGFDVVINNAGINAIRRFEDLDVAFIQTVMGVNFLGPVLLTHALLKADLLRRGACVCNIVSDAAWRPMRHSLAYNCSKAALDMATKQMARELTKPYDISVFGVRPGKMSGTAMSEYIDRQVCELRGWTPDQAKAYYEQNSVSGEEFNTTAVARLIVHLCTSGLPISGACMDLAG